MWRHEQSRCVEREHREPWFFTHQLPMGHWDVTILIRTAHMGTLKSVTERKGTTLRGHHLAVENAECGWREERCSPCDARSHKGVVTRRCRPLQGMRLPIRSAVNVQTLHRECCALLARESDTYMQGTTSIAKKHNKSEVNAQTLQECGPTHAARTALPLCIAQCTPTHDI